MEAKTNFFFKTLKACNMHSSENSNGVFLIKKLQRDSVMRENFCINQL